MNRPIAVTHVVLSLDVGGLERIVVDLIRAGPALGQVVSVACLERAGTLADEAERLGARVLVAGKSPGLRPSGAARMRSVLRELRPDVLHTHQIGALLYAGPASWSLGRPPILHTEHGKHYHARRRTRMIGRLAGRFAAHFLAVSADIAAEVADHRIVPRRKLGVVPNGIDVDRFGGDDRPGTAALRARFAIPADAPVVGTVGRLCEVKRQDRLIRAFRNLEGIDPEPHLLLVGDGPLRASLAGLARELGVADRVHFAGYQSHPELFLSIMSVFALTSQSEGMPLSIIEAWAAGLPVVATRVGGVPEMIEEGRTGLMVEPDDEVGLAARIATLIGDRDRARSLAHAGRAIARERFSLQAMAGAYDRLYRRAIVGAAREVCG